MTPSLTTLQRDGVLELGRAFTATQIADVWAHLNPRPRFDGHVKIDGHPVRSDSVHTCWGQADVLTAPHLFDYALGLTAFVGDYLLTAEPLLFSVNAFTMHPSAQPLSPDTQEYHRDKDDARFLALFVYLTGVSTPTDGAHQFLTGTHDGAPTGERVTVLGPSGTAFLSDGRGLHKGLRPTAAPRTIVWMRWGVTNPPPAYVWCKLQPIAKDRLGDRYPVDERLQRSIRLVAA